MKGIYEIKNKINGKKYIGSSIDLEKRIYHHKNVLKNNKHKNSHLQYAWNKYGEENFEFNILEYCDDKILELEQKYIDEEDFENLYNINLLATGGCQFSQEAIDKRKLTMKRKYDNGELDYVKEILKNKTPWNKGKKYSSTDHLKVPKEKKPDRTNQINTQRNNNPNIQVFDINMNYLGEWRSAKDIEELSLQDGFILKQYMILRNPNGRQSYSPYLLQSVNINKSSNFNKPYKGLFFKKV